jgi:hypothetical protein
MPLTRKRRAMDNELDDETLKEALAFLQTKLGQDDFATLKKILGATKDEDMDEDMGEDSPPSSKGMPKPGGAMAADARGTSFSEMFPDAARIKVWL